MGVLHNLSISIPFLFQVRELFQMYDRDADDSLDLNELMQLLKNLSSKITALPAVRKMSPMSGSYDRMHLLDGTSSFSTRKIPWFPFHSYRSTSWWVWCGWGHSRKRRWSRVQAIRVPPFGPTGVCRKCRCVRLRKTILHRRVGSNVFMAGCVLEWTSQRKNEGFIDDWLDHPVGRFSSATLRYH